MTGLFQYFVLTLCAFGFKSSASAQYFSKSIDINQDAEQGWQIIEHQNYYYALAPHYCELQEVCTSVIKFDSIFQIVWKKTYPGILPETYNSLIALDSFLFFGGRLLHAIDSFELAVIKIDLEGEFVNEFLIGTVDSDYFSGLINSQNGEFTILLNSRNKDDIINLNLMSFDLQGEILWTKKYNVGYHTITAYSAVQGAWNEFLISGVGCHDFLCQDRETFIIKVDQLGTIVSTIVDSSDISISNYYSFAISDLLGNVYLAKFGLSESSNLEVPVVIKFDSTGNELWRYYFDYLNYSLINRLKLSEDGSVFGVGLNENHPFIDTTSNLRRERGGWLFKFDANGLLVWNRIYGDINFPSPGFGELIDMIEVRTGSLICIGSIVDTLINVIPQRKSLDVWLLYLNNNGCYSYNCTEGFNLITQTDLNTINYFEDPFLIYPNPCNEKLYIKNIDNINNNSKFKYSLFNYESKSIKSDIGFFENGEAYISLSDLTTGYYILSIQNIKNSKGEPLFYSFKLFIL